MPNPDKVSFTTDICPYYRAVPGAIVLGTLLYFNWLRNAPVYSSFNCTSSFVAVLPFLIQKQYQHNKKQQREGDHTPDNNDRDFRYSSA